MVLTGDSPWRTIGDLTYSQFVALIPSTSPMWSERSDLYNAVRGFSALYAAQANHESRWGTTGIATTGGHNALGNKVPGGNNQYMSFNTWTDNAAWWKARITNPDGPYYNTKTIAEYVHVYAPASDGNDEAAYVAAIVKVGNLDPMVNQTTPGKGVTIAGLPGGPLDLSFAVDTTTNMIDPSNVYQRPGTPLAKPYRWVQHGTGNPNSLAASDAAWVAGGASGIQESMHFEIDDTECYQLVPVNEVTWQAADGNGPGNMTGVSCEMSENEALWSDQSRVNAIIARAAELGGKIAARLNIDKPQQHWDFNYADPNRHDCPNKLRHVTLPDGTLAWDRFTSLWYAAKATELGAQGYAPKHPLQKGTFVSNGVIYFYAPQSIPTIAVTTPREYADPGAKATGPDIPAGTIVNLSHVVTGSDGALWAVGTGGSRISTAAFVKGS